MLSAADIALIAAGGYWWYYLVDSDKYKLSRKSGHRLYLPLLLRGLVVYAITSTLTFFAIYYLVDTDIDALASKIYFTPLYICWGIGIAGLLVNLYVFALKSYRFFFKIKHTDESAIIEAWQEGDDLEIMCSRAIAQQKLVHVSLINRKSYIGFIARTLEADSDWATYLTLSPIYSGYRKGKNLNLKVTHAYSEAIGYWRSLHNNELLLDKLREENSEQDLSELKDEIKDTKNLLRSWEVVVPRGQIMVSHIFHFDTHASVKEQVGYTDVLSIPTIPTVDSS